MEIPYMDNKKFLNEISIGRDLHSAIRHLVIVAARLFEVEEQMAEVCKHLGMDKADEIGN
jgi:hypothetical protein